MIFHSYVTVYQRVSCSPGLGKGKYILPELREITNLRSADGNQVYICVNWACLPSTPIFTNLSQSLSNISYHTALCTVVISAPFLIERDFLSINGKSGNPPWSCLLHILHAPPTWTFGDATPPTSWTRLHFIVSSYLESLHLL